MRHLYAEGDCEMSFCEGKEQSGDGSNEKIMLVFTENHRKK